MASAKSRPVTPEVLPSKFEARIDKTSNGCWLWLGGQNGKGYGKFHLGRRNRVLAHRWSYEHFVGPIADGLVLDHLCRVPLCVNPAHLEPVIPAENTFRGEGPAAKNAAKTHCINGHLFSEENTYLTPDGYRVCRACQRATVAAYRERKAAKCVA